MRTPKRNFYPRPSYKKWRFPSNSFLTFFGGVSVVIGILVLSGVGLWDSLGDQSQMAKRVFQPLVNNNKPPVDIPNIIPPKSGLDTNLDSPENSYLQSALGNKAQIQLVSVLRVPGKTDQVNVQWRIYRNAEQVTPTDTINLGATTAKNSISGEIYTAVNPVKQSSGIVALSNIPLGKSVDAYVVLRIPEKAIVLDIFAENAKRFKNVLIGISEAVTSASIPPVGLTSPLPKMTIPGQTPIPGSGVYSLPPINQTATLPEVSVPSNPTSKTNTTNTTNATNTTNTTNIDISNALAIAIGQNSPSPQATIPRKTTNQATPTPISSLPNNLANLINQEVKTSKMAITPPPPPTLVNRGRKSSSVTPTEETTKSPEIPLADKLAPTLQGHTVSTLNLGNNDGFKPGEFAQLAYGTKARVELISVQRVPDKKSANPEVVSVQMRISRLDEKVEETNVIKLGETTARNGVSEQTYKVMNSPENVPIPVALKDIPQDGSVDTYVWLKVPKGVYTIDIYVPETGAFKNVPISN